MRTASTLTINLPALLAKCAGGAWTEVPGPGSRVGVDYWYRSGDRSAYVNIDQDEITISVDGDPVLQGSIDDAHLRRFIGQDPIRVGQTTTRPRRAFPETQ